MRRERRPGAVLVLAGALALFACAGTKPTVTPGIGDRARTLEEASHETALRGDLRRAAVLQQRAIDAYRRIDDVAGIAGGLNRLGNLLQRAGDREEARRAYLEAAALARQSGTTSQEAAAENNLGTLAEESGDAAAARVHYERALDLARSAGDASVEAAALNNLGLLALAGGRLDEARERFEAALSLDRAEEDRGGEATRLRNLGALDVRAGDFAAAVDSFQQAHDLDREREDVPAIALDLVALSEARAASGGDLTRAIGERARARDIHRFLGDEAAVRTDDARIPAWCARLGTSAPAECRS